MSNIRQPAVAGTFYPADPAELRSMVRSFLDQAQARAPRPKALIAPHAGYIYSGPIAASAYTCLEAAQHADITRVLIFGPSHRVPFRGLALTSAKAYATPLGIIPIDEQASRLLRDRVPDTLPLDEAHAYEHSIEVQLPFLQLVLHEFSIIPVVVGDTDPARVADAINTLWDDDATLVVVSSDLSHYHDYSTARRIDRQTTSAIETLQPEKIDYHQACGRIPVAGLLLAAREHHLQPQTVDLRNSGDTSGPRDQVVGYGAYVFS